MGGQQPPSVEAEPPAFPSLTRNRELALKLGYESQAKSSVFMAIRKPMYLVAELWWDLVLWKETGCGSDVFSVRQLSEVLG